MNSSYFPALAALLGTVLGGLTSFLTSWTTQTAQTKAQRLAVAKTKREDLYGRFLDEMARLFSHAFSENRVNYSVLVDIFALKGRIRLVASPAVFEVADQAVKHILDIYMGPVLEASEVRKRMDDIDADFMNRFAEVCRIELQTFETA
jgi:hypothetical protein